jgi:hypothetical protein
MKQHEVESVDFEGDTLVLRVDGGVFRMNMAKISPRLANASDAVRRNFVVSPAGCGLHWPEADEDLSVDGLIREARGNSPTVVAPAEAFAMHDKPAK